MNEIKKASFIKSSVTLEQCPEAKYPEFAFIGRSNVGKSSLINMLANKKSLAKISGNPGKTQTINHFLIDNAWYLVDLPGYGYAKVSKTQRKSWWKMIDQYLLLRSNLVCLFVLIDSRIPPQEIDMEFIQNLGENGVPFCIVYTKTDKLNKTALDRNIQAIEERLKKDWDELPKSFITSARDKNGREELLGFMGNYVR